ncbi:hypothetical protein GCM10009603_41310 [Nocardiopsis exhalans]
MHADVVLQRGPGDARAQGVESLGVDVDGVHPHIPSGEREGVVAVPATDVEQPVPAYGQLATHRPDPPGDRPDPEGVRGFTESATFAHGHHPPLYEYLRGTLHQVTL